MILMRSVIKATNPAIAGVVKRSVVLLYDSLLTHDVYFSSSD